MNYLKHRFYNLLTAMIVLLIFVFSSAIFLTFLGFGSCGLSRILIRFRLGDLTCNRSMYDSLLCYGSYMIFGYLVIFVVEHLMDYLRKMLPENAYFRGATFRLISYTVATTLFYFTTHLNYVCINIDFWVVMAIIGSLYVCKLQFYPESRNLNNGK